jgi:hypothetical protein
MGSHILNLDGQIIDIDRQLMEISRAECEEDLAMFVRQAWHVIEPGQPYIHGWHIDFLCEPLTQTHGMSWSQLWYLLSLAVWLARLGTATSNRVVR